MKSLVLLCKQKSFGFALSHFHGCISVLFLAELGKNRWTNRSVVIAPSRRAIVYEARKMLIKAKQLWLRLEFSRLHLVKMAKICEDVQHEFIDITKHYSRQKLSQYVWCYFIIFHVATIHLLKTHCLSWNLECLTYTESNFWIQHTIMTRR